MSISTKLENPYIGSSPPSEIYLGRTWLEPTANGVENWIWSGVYWLSQQTFHYQFSTTALGNTNFSVIYPVDRQYNVFLTSLIASIQVNAISTSTTHWFWNLGRITDLGSPTILGSANSIGQAANVWQAYKTIINSHVNLSATGTVGFRLSEGRTGTVSKQGTIGFEFKKARI